MTLLLKMTIPEMVVDHDRYCCDIDDVVLDAIEENTDTIELDRIQLTLIAHMRLGVVVE